MNIKLELLKNCISDFVNSHIEDFEINADERAQEIEDFEAGIPGNTVNLRK